MDYTNLITADVAVARNLITKPEFISIKNKIDALQKEIKGKGFLIKDLGMGNLFINVKNKKLFLADPVFVFYPEFYETVLKQIK